jgi:hypothetical protein
MKFFKKTDIIIISVLLVLAIGGYFAYKKIFSDTKAIANIYYESELVKSIDLSEKKDYTFRLEQNDHVLIHVHSDGSISFEESDCPDKVCIKSGKLDTVGESAACLPNKIVIKLVSKGKDNNDVDIIVGK